MITPPRFIEGLLGLPLPLLAFIVLGVWASIALVVHRVVVPRLAGPDGAKIGHFEPEVASQLGIVLGLLLSFNAVTVWEQSSAARDATIQEASALREVADLLPELPADQRQRVRGALLAYIDYVTDTEWPTLGGKYVGLDKPAPLRTLSHLGRATSNDDLHDSIATAVDARNARIRIATSRMLPARWGIVLILGMLTLVSIGLVHAENRRARAIAIGMIAFAIASCFVVLMVQVRPFFGALALKPTELRELAVSVRTPAADHSETAPSGPVPPPGLRVPGTGAR